MRGTRGRPAPDREKAADVGEVVDADADVDDHGAESDDQIDGGELDHAGAEPPQLFPGEGQAAVGEQDDQDAGDAKDGARGARADLEQKSDRATSAKTTFQAMLSRFPAIPVIM